KLDLCAVCKSSPTGSPSHSSIPPCGVRDFLMNSDSGENRIKVSVLVDIRQLSDDPQNVMSPWPSTVRLNTLDECKSRFGDTRQNALETVIGERGCNVTTFDLFLG